MNVLSLPLPLALAGAAFLLPVLPAGRAELVKPNAPQIQYLGRFEFSDPSKVAFSWSGSTIRFALNAPEATVLLGGARVRYGVRVNGKDVDTQFAGGEQKELTVTLPAGEKRPAVVEIIRINQPLFGVSSFSGIEVPSRSALVAPPPPPKRWIEIIGDSITAGHGNEATDRGAPLTPDTENFLRTYGKLAADAFGAGLLAEAWSGIRLNKGTSNDVTSPERWRWIVPNDNRGEWKFAVKPDVVVVNLGTNDFNGNAPEEAEWKADYAAFLEDIRARYPQAIVFLTNGPMLDAEKSARLQKWTDEFVAARNAAGDRKLFTFYFAPQRMEDGIGGQWHPNLRTHAIMANKLITEIAAKTGWSAEPVELPPAP